MRVRFPITTTVVTTVVFAFVLWSAVEIHTVHGSSMEPYAFDGQIVIVHRGAYRFATPAVGDVVIAMHPLTGEPTLKRLSSISSDLYVELHGDNPLQSVDSRHYGAVPRTLLRGRVVFVGPRRNG